jgi:hypothetical protein
MAFSFLSTIPLNVDRSFTVWTLNQMSMEKTPISEIRLIEKSTMFFDVSNGEISRRIYEQVRLKNIEKVSGGVQLTRRGKLQVIFHRVIQEIFNLNSKYTKKSPL